MNSFDLKELEFAQTLTDVKNQRYKYVSQEYKNYVADPPYDLQIEVSIEQIEEEHNDKTARETPETDFKEKLNILKRKRDTQVALLQKKKRQNSHLNDELVPIGPGGTLLPRSTLRSVPWELHTKATRTLLRAVFSSELLRISSLTGNKSNAHPDMPAKRALDPIKVADIMYIVAQKCSVDESCLKKCITSACADEAKKKPNKTPKCKS